MVAVLNGKGEGKKERKVALIKPFFYLADHCSGRSISPLGVEKI